mmetsp:Transcript_11616/g.11996  ORF Transcript_11616/g.11996 Transcript_11616/m.11996 type:complete len:230 (+) Transcript_11616:56-745(+)
MTSHTQQPIVTGSTVIGIKYSNGIMLASDTLCSYGTLARYKNIQRINRISSNILIGSSGEYSDYQYILKKLEELYQEDVNLDDGYIRSPNEIHQYLRAIMYQRRNKMNPLWNQLLVAGYQKDKLFLGYVDMIGTAYEENYIATGYGAYLAIPLIRERWNPDLEEGEARALLEDCLRVLWYRDCKASNKIQIAKSTAEGTIISDPYELEHNWDTANFDLRHSAPTDGSSW